LALTKLVGWVFALSTVSGAIQRGAEFAKRRKLKAAEIINVKK